jgi:tRNA splicing endonuclease
MNLRDREDRMDQYIRQAISNGTIGNREGRRDLRDLANIRRMEADYRSADGHLNDGQRADIDQRLDSLRDRLHMQNDQRSY